MDKKKEVSERLKCISKLLKEIEDIICERQSEPQQVKNDSSICKCGQQFKSTQEIYLVQTKNNKENCSKYKKIKNNDSEKYLKSQELNRKKMSPDIKDSAILYSRKNYKKSNEKNNYKVPRDDKRGYKNERVPEDYANDEFKCKLNDIRQKFLTYFEDLNGN